MLYPLWSKHINWKGLNSLENEQSKRKICLESINFVFLLLYFSKRFFENQTPFFKPELEMKQVKAEGLWRPGQGTRHPHHPAIGLRQLCKTNLLPGICFENHHSSKHKPQAKAEKDVNYWKKAWGHWLISTSLILGV